MLEFSHPICFTGPAVGAPSRAPLKSLLGLLVVALLLGLCPAQADESDDQYLQIYDVIQQADALSASGKRVAAKAKFLEAYKELNALKKANPYWNPTLMHARLKYVTEQITVLSEEPVAPAASGGTNASETKTETKAATPSSNGPLKLLGAGAEPRKALRLHPAAGDKQALLLNAKLALETKMMGSQPAPFKLPSTTATLDIPVELTIKEVSAKGDVTYDVTLGDASAAEGAAGGAPQGAPPKKTSVGGVKGLSATGTISSQGVSKGLDFKLPPGADPQTRMLMDLLKDVFIQLVTPLPEEPIGPGAKWQVKAPVQSHSIKIEQTADYELVSAEGDSFKTKSSTTQRAGPNQKIDNPMMPGVKMDLIKWTGKASSDFGLDAAKLMPTSGTMELHTEMGMGINMGAQSQGFVMKVDVNLQIQGK